MIEPGKYLECWQLHFEKSIKWMEFDWIEQWKTYRNKKMVCIRCPRTKYEKLLMPCKEKKMTTQLEVILWMGNSILPNRWAAKCIAEIEQSKNVSAIILSYCFCWVPFELENNFKYEVKIHKCLVRIFLHFFVCFDTYSPHMHTHTSAQIRHKDIKSFFLSIFSIRSAAARHSSPGNVLTAHNFIFNTHRDQVLSSVVGVHVIFDISFVLYRISFCSKWHHRNAHTHTHTHLFTSHTLPSSFEAVQFVEAYTVHTQTHSNKPNKFHWTKISFCRE